MTEATYLLRTVEDLTGIITSRERAARGEDGKLHSLTLYETGDGHSEPREAWYRCSCGPHWIGDTWLQTGYPDPDPERFPAAMDPIINVWSWLHHVWPSRYGARPSTIMMEILRGMRTDGAHL